MATATKAKKPKKPKDDKHKLTAEETREFHDLTRALAEEIKERRTSYEQKKAASKSAKEMLAGSIAELERVTFEYTHPESLGLFRDAAKAEANGHANGQANGKPAVVHPPTGEEWKATPIREALTGLGKKVYEGMERLQLDTIGKLFDWKNSHESKWWTDIDGIGKAAATKLDDAIERFLEQRKKIEDAKAKVGKPEEATTEMAK